MALPARAHQLAHRFGVDLLNLRYADSDAFARNQLLNSLRPSLVVDVGANTGQYASELRMAGYTGPILSIEPLDDAYQALVQRAAGDDSWQCLQAALGAESTQSVIHVSANSMSSSLATMSSEHLQAAPDSATIREQSVTVRRFDELTELTELTELVNSQRIFLKIDTQGFEEQVLAGIGDRWADLVGIQLETSHLPLYDGAWLHPQVMAYFAERGWEPVFVERGFTDARTGRVLQSDWTFAPIGAVGV
ncbi:MAG: FkbM family methyltransferase [Actinomycetales bacterium]